MKLSQRLLEKDSSLWPEPNVSQNRLGWLEVANLMKQKSSELTSWAKDIPYNNIFLLGMGGSSLGPEVLASCAPAGFEPKKKLTVIDTTDPQTIQDQDIEDGFFIVSSKSGSTLEVHCLFSYFWEKVPDPSRYIAITDPGTPLEKLAREKGFSAVFINPSDIGGRYSVLSYFGLVPAALIGYNIEKFCSDSYEIDIDQAVELGVSMGQAARQGKNKINIVVPPKFKSFGLWAEQLIAESTGKHERGCVPVPSTELEPGNDRFSIKIDIDSPEQLSKQFYRLEIAVAIAGHVLEIDPFDEPNVAESKQNTAKALESLPLGEIPTSPPSSIVGWLKENAKENDYISIQAYLPFGQDDELENLRKSLANKTSLASTAGYGPRFLHSTGQLHKGGPNEILAIQIVRSSSAPVVEIPGKNYDFGTLQAAQAYGDYQSLKAHHRRVLRVASDELSSIIIE